MIKEQNLSKFYGPAPPTQPASKFWPTPKYHGPRGVRKITPEDNWPPRKIASRTIAPRIIAPEENWPPDKCYLGDCSQKITPMIIAPWQYPPWKLPPSAFRIMIICPQEHCSKDKFHTIYFFPKNQKSYYFNG